MLQLMRRYPAKNIKHAGLKYHRLPCEPVGKSPPEHQVELQFGMTVQPAHRQGHRMPYLQPEGFENERMAGGHDLKIQEVLVKGKEALIPRVDYARCSLMTPQAAGPTLTFPDQLDRIRDNL